MRSIGQDLHQSAAPGTPHGPATLESVYRQHFTAVWRLLRRLGVPEPQLDDAAQDVFLVVQKKLGQVALDSPIQRPALFVFSTLTECRFVF